MRVRIVTTSEHSAVDTVLDAVIARLAAAGIDAGWSHALGARPGDRDVVITHESLPDPPRHACVLGQRLLNRRQRLVVLAHAGVRVAPWAAPRDGRGVLALFDRWGADEILYKADWSWRRKGVVVVRRDATLGYDRTGDIFMRILDGDPTTYKAYLFRGTLIGASAYRTPAVHDAHFHHDPHPLTAFDPSPRLRALASRAGAALAAYGTGYVSVDFMRSRGRYFVIEANTAGVGIVGNWVERPRLFADRYAAGILAWLRTAGRPPSLASLERRCRAVDRLRGAYDDASLQLGRR